MCFGQGRGTWVSGCVLDRVDAYGEDEDIPSKHHILFHKLASPKSVEN